MSPRIRRVSGLIIVPPTYEDLRLTIPCREALSAAGCSIIAGASEWWAQYRAGLPYLVNRVTLSGTVPRGIVECLIGHGDEQHRGLRLDVEPEYPGEWSEGGIAWHERGQWVPCPAPRCGRALVWYEAVYVPGYRVCTRGHHAQLSTDGRSARVVREG